jgi:hypothetical protein
MSGDKAIPVAPVASEAQPEQTEHDLQRALTGKIARLPEDIREQLNKRLLDGLGGNEILAWLNDLPAVKEILAAQFSGVPVNHENLSNWRHSGYERWRRHQRTQDLRKYAADITKAADGQFAPAAAAVASGKIFEFLDSTEAAQSDPNNLVRCSAAAAALLKMEQNNERLTIARERLRQHETGLRLRRDKQFRDGVVMALRIFEDTYARQIATAPISNAEKIEAIGLHMFGKFWDPRPLPEPPKPS